MVRRMLLIFTGLLAGCGDPASGAGALQEGDEINLHEPGSLAGEFGFEALIAVVVGPDDSGSWDFFAYSASRCGNQGDPHVPVSPESLLVWCDEGVFDQPPVLLHDTQWTLQTHLRPSSGASLAGALGATATIWECSEWDEEFGAVNTTHAAIGLVEVGTPDGENVPIYVDLDGLQGEVSALLCAR